VRASPPGAHDPNAKARRRGRARNSQIHNCCESDTPRERSGPVGSCAWHRPAPRREPTCSDAGPRAGQVGPWVGHFGHPAVASTATRRAPRVARRWHWTRACLPRRNERRRSIPHPRRRRPPNGGHGARCSTRRSPSTTATSSRCYPRCSWSVASGRNVSRDDIEPPRARGVASRSRTIHSKAIRSTTIRSTRSQRRSRWRRDAAAHADADRLRPRTSDRYASGRIARTSLIISGSARGPRLARKAVSRPKSGGVPDAVERTRQFR
jgi:hypothetical protein